MKTLFKTVLSATALLAAISAQAGIFECNTSASQKFCTDGGGTVTTFAAAPDMKYCIFTKIATKKDDFFQKNKILAAGGENPSDGMKPVTSSRVHDPVLPRKSMRTAPCPTGCVQQGPGCACPTTTSPGGAPEAKTGPTKPPISPTNPPPPQSINKPTPVCGPGEKPPCNDFGMPRVPGQ